MKRKFLASLLLSIQVLAAAPLVVADPLSSSRAFAVAETSQATITLYRMYNPSRNVYLYTKNPEEYNGLTSKGWKREGVAWYSSSTQGEIVYRLFHPERKVHLYTKNPSEYTNLPQQGWKKEGVAFRSYGSLPIYRLYNSQLKRHFYTRHLAEYKILQARGWHGEGIAFYGLEKPVTIDPAELEKAEQELAAAQATLAETKKAKAEKAEQLETAKKAAEEARQTQAQQKETIAAELARLEAAVKEASDANVSSRQMVVENRPAHAEEDSRPAGIMTETQYAGEHMEYIHLTAQQVEDFKANRQFTYQPDMEALTAEIVANINELKRLNGIPGQVVVDPAVIAFAKDRVAEFAATGNAQTPTSLAFQNYLAGATTNHEQSHDSLFAPTYNGAGEMSFGVTSKSDKELAYYLVLGWFTSYYKGYESTADIESRYSTAVSLLSGSGKVGAAIDYTSPFFDGYTSSYSVLNRFTNPAEEQADVRADFSLRTEANGETTLLYKGNRLTFLPKTTFRYHYDEQAQAVELAQKRLDDYKAYAEQELAKAQAWTSQTAAEQAEAQTSLDEAKAACEAAQAAVDKAQALVDRLKTP